VTAPDPAAIQATILKGHGRDFGAHVFVRHEGLGREDVRALAAAVGVTSAAAQQVAADRWRRDPTAWSPPVHVILLSARGLEACGQSGALPGASAFWEGMARRTAALGDPPLDGGAALEAQLMIVLADDSERVLEADIERVRRALPAAAQVHVEWARTIRGRGTGTYEPFGFADGISDPVLGPTDGWRLPPTGVWWSPVFPLDQVLVAWQEGDGPAGHGSFLVYRKLEQHVDAFRAAMADGARQAGRTTFEEAARTVGRDTDGTPLAEATPGSWNDFSYATDPQGTRCPFSAHIRAVNPRTTENRWRMIARRGMPYRSPDGAEVGLLFMAYMADIEGQFEWMQHRANQVGDRIAGQGSGSELVTLRDGQYFFAPPLSFF
jgi:Dyp-type peroxidase family